ncbi:DUF3012 domain-containing protein [Teredinibacter turnerae]|uniref:DUF3012 domain-containing protein n=1 Tax=Teredinibacter turnerae TaxID=2426 RepID=UPI0005F83800|nr:DUF3012 domain-containing protein [Teredinibacter turnerae]
MLVRFIGLTMVIGFVSACSPEVGSAKWCNGIEKDDFMELSSDDKKVFQKECVLNGKKTK